MYQQLLQDSQSLLCHQVEYHFHQHMFELSQKVLLSLFDQQLKILGVKHSVNSHHF
jgi:hypothetical protein